MSDKHNHSKDFFEELFKADKMSDPRHDQQCTNCGRVFLRGTLIVKRTFIGTKYLCKECDEASRSNDH